MPVPFPWENLKADTLRGVCRDLGAHTKRKKEEMLEFIKGVEDNGLEATLKTIEAEEQNAPASATPKKGANKRSRSAHEENGNGAETTSGRPKRGRAAAKEKEPTTPTSRTTRGKAAQKMDAVVISAGRRSGRGGKKGKDAEAENGEAAPAAGASSPERGDADAAGEAEAEAEAEGEAEAEAEAEHEVAQDVAVTGNGAAAAPGNDVVTTTTVVEETVQITAVVEPAPEVAV
ncbi:hypothetical protein DENSPDRAFT_836745 [Dentipellis sp. KUC8613]|nr:hypothetical protein DENSPDRAFT_836745 [Dentipellis sp. KUC8613]